MVAESSEFEAWFGWAEPRVRRALVSMLGADRGREAASEAMVHAWLHWARVASMEFPIAYLCKVGRSRTRPRRSPILPWRGRGDRSDPWVEPGLHAALAALSDQQRSVVVLIHGLEWTVRETATFYGLAPSTVQTHLERGMAKVRLALEVNSDA